MINAWSLLYDEIYGDDEMTDNRVTPQESDEYDPKPQSDSNDADWNDPIITVGSGNTASEPEHSPYYYDWDRNGKTENPFEIDIPDSIGSVDTDTLNISIPPEFTVPETSIPSIESPLIRKYKEDESIKALQDYISTTYGGHYTSDQNNVQTLDLIDSVGDAESFCRSNAIKYLSRYDKKGQAKRDILKALHYSLLLYYFSGQLNETKTRGYETF